MKIWTEIFSGSQKIKHLIIEKNDSLINCMKIARTDINLLYTLPMNVNLIYSSSYHRTSTAEGLFLKSVRTQGRNPHASASPEGGVPDARNQTTNNWQNNCWTLIVMSHSVYWYIPYLWTLMGMSHTSYCYIPNLWTLMGIFNSSYCHILSLSTLMGMSHSSYCYIPYLWTLMGMSNTAYCYIPYQWILIGMSHSAYCYIPYLWTIMGISHSSYCYILHLWTLMGISHSALDTMMRGGKDTKKLVTASNVIKIAISFLTSVLVISHSVTFCYITTRSKKYSLCVKSKISQKMFLKWPIFYHINHIYWVIFFC